MADNSTTFSQTADNTTKALLRARNAAGHWEGKLSSSALSTATAIFALHTFQQSGAIDVAMRDQIRKQVHQGLDWLCTHQNADGGWGDTVASLSNISTTALCWAALSIDNQASRIAMEKGERWLAEAAGSLEPRKIADAIKARYGKDKTFSVPILTMCVLAGRLGPADRAWRWVPQLPFELAACPHKWFAWLRLPVVSYALSALIAMGQVRHAHRPTWNPLLRLIRSLTSGRTLRILEQIQPEGGGFLEATPLTSFVVMSLVGGGRSRHPVAIRGVEFLLRSMREDGSWAIDTNLSTWVTTLSVNALASQPDFDRLLSQEDRQKIRDWLLSQQYRTEHRYTHAPPGAWAWTDLPGGVPDADDTAGALIALSNLGSRKDRVLDAAKAAITWLLDIQNRDGGIPTFCRGWGNLPFDRSGSDLTAHALLAWETWAHSLPPDLQTRIITAAERGRAFLRSQQRSDGAWTPLWFGNQFAIEEMNLTYGTSKVLTALCAQHATMCEADRAMIRRGAAFFQNTQNSDGGWGSGVNTPSSIEETALAVAALAVYLAHADALEGEAIASPLRRGVQWLADRTKFGSEFPASPIGLYFAKLWYFERDYPAIYCAAAMGSAARILLG